MKKAELLGVVFLSAISLQAIMVAKAHAQDGLMETLDLDKDGFISLKEATSNPMLLKSFGSIDSNEDGRLSLEELNESKLDVTKIKSAHDKKSESKKDDKVSG